MSLIRMQLWRKCILLHSKAVDASLQQYSTRVQLCPVVWNSIKAPMVSSMLQGRRTSTQIWHRWTLGGHGQSHAKTLTTEVKDSGANVDFPGHSHAKTLTTEVKDNGADVGCSLVDAVSFRNPHSQQLTDAMSKVDRQQVTDLNLDDVPPPHLSPLEEISDVEAVSLSLNIPSAMPPASSTLRDYVDDSETLSKLVQLGVDLWKLEQRPNVGTMLLKLDFVTDVVPRLVFLKQIGVEDSRLGHLLSHNPFILTESLENLQARVDFLLSKKFSSEAVASMVSRAPYLLNFSVKRLDNRLAFFQENLNLSPQKTRDIVARLPRMLCGRLESIKENLQVFKREFGFRENDMQHIVTRIPKVLTSNKKKLTQIFDYVHNTMNVPIHLIVKFPQALNSKYLRIRERHLFLQYLGKAQYDPTQPNYIALDRFVVTPDEIFCTELASATLKDFELFQKTL